MAETRVNATETTATSLPLFEQVFRLLPPLGSEAYLAHIQSSAAEDLPPEVLARALRQLPSEHPATRPTLDRLLHRRPDGTWDYLSPVIAQARRQSRISKHDDHEDVMQDALRRITQTIRTERGALAERSWHAYCRRETIDAWRQRYGRRGERLPREGQAEFDPEEEEDPLNLVCDPPAWHANPDPQHVTRIDEVLQIVIAQIPDEFVRDLARATWLAGKRPKVSRARGAPNEESALTDLFPTKSRDQINRALRKADAQLAAALLTDPTLHLNRDAKAWLEKIRAAGKPLARRSKE